MNQTHRKLTTCLLVSCLAISLPLLADTAPTIPSAKLTTLTLGLSNGVMISALDTGKPVKSSIEEEIILHENKESNTIIKELDSTTDNDTKSYGSTIEENTRELPPIEEKSVPESSTMETPSMKEESDEEEKTPEETVVGFSLQHTTKGQTLEKTQVKASPFVLLQAFKTNLLDLLKQHGKPLHLDTQVEMLLAEQFRSEIKDLPPLTIKTEVDTQGQAKSELTIVPFRMAETDGRVIDWQGLTGQVMFNETFDSLSTALKLADLTFQDKAEDLTVSLSPVTLSGTLDADFFPTQMEFKLPLLKITEDQDQINIKEVSLDSKVEKSSSGVDLNNGTFKIGHLGVTEKAATQFSLDRLEITGNGKELNNLVTYTLRTHIDQMTIAEVTPKENMEMSYRGEIEIRNIDAPAAKDLQQMVRNLQKQVQAGGISKEMVGFVMIGKLMELAPRLMAQSPELSFSQLRLQTTAGDLQGGFKLGLDGNKATSVELNKLVTAILAKADFIISKSLLKTIMILGNHVNAEAGKKSSKRKSTAPTPEQQIQTLLDQKYLVVEGDNYKLAATFERGKFVLNGQTILLPWLDSMIQKPAP